MTQKDAKTNIALVESSAAIAKAAKADSSAMKTIAVLGMFFLPGAFVAVSFQNPILAIQNISFSRCTKSRSNIADRYQGNFRNAGH